MTVTVMLVTWCYLHGHQHKRSPTSVTNIEVTQMTSHFLTHSLTNINSFNTPRRGMVANFIFSCKILFKLLETHAVDFKCILLIHLMLRVSEPDQ